MEEIILWKRRRSSDLRKHWMFSNWKQFVFKLLKLKTVCFQCSHKYKLFSDAELYVLSMQILNEPVFCNCLKVWVKSLLFISCTEKAACATCDRGHSLARELWFISLSSSFSAFLTVAWFHCSHGRSSSFEYLSHRSVVRSTYFIHILLHVAVPIFCWLTPVIF